LERHKHAEVLVVTVDKPRADLGSEQHVLDATQQPDATAKPLSAKAQKKLDEMNRRKEKADQELQAKVAREQAKHDADAARTAAEEAKRQAKKDTEAARAAADLSRKSK